MAHRGARLLRGKREVLAAELFALVRDVAEGRARLDVALHEAARALVLARGLAGEARLESLAATARRDVPVRVEPRQVWGVPVPRVQAGRIVRAVDARGASPASWGPAAADAARAHEAALELLAGLATRELQLGRVAEEIRATSRRIHALEDVLAPRLAAEAARVALGLEERAREESIRLKRFRAARAKPRR
jgi:V/A-type H+-transporting ATPase subunit D